MQPCNPKTTAGNPLRAGLDRRQGERRKENAYLSKSAFSAFARNHASYGNPGRPLTLTNSTRATPAPPKGGATREREALDNLTFSLRQICAHNRDGSRMTQAQRQSGLMAIAAELRALGYKLPDARSIKSKHVNALLGYWRSRGISDATMKNRLGWMRWWSMKCSKPGLIPHDNAELGVAEKSTFKGQRAAVTTGANLDKLPERMALAIRLQMAFGLRLEESLKFRPIVADQGAYVALLPGWCKGGRSRVIDLVHTRQRELLDEAHRICGEGSVIPPGLSYIAFRKQFERVTLAQGVTNCHKHRHWYAAWRYRALTGLKPPAEGGPTYNGLSIAERARLDEARLLVSQELGHNRIDVTDAYLGPRWAAKEPKESRAA